MSEGETLSVVVPAFREESRLPASLARLAAELDAAGAPPFEVVVVDDGSDDATSSALASAPRTVEAAVRTRCGRSRRRRSRAGVGAAVIGPRS